METHYGIIKHDNSVMNIYWYESKEFVQEKMNNFIEVDKNCHPIRMIAIQIIE